MLRANSKLRQQLGEPGVEFLEHDAGAIQRILPHVEVSTWQEDSWSKPGSTWTSSGRTGIRITLTVGEKKTGRSLTAVVERRHLPGIGGSVGKILDQREHHICGLIASRVSEVLKQGPPVSSEASLRAIRDAFDEYVVAQHVEMHHGLERIYR